MCKRPLCTPCQPAVGMGLIMNYELKITNYKLQILNPQLLNSQPSTQLSTDSYRILIIRKVARLGYLSYLCSDNFRDGKKTRTLFL